MANLSLNTTYNKTQSTSSPLANLSSITKLLQENSQKKSADTFKSSLMSHYNPDTFTQIFGSTNNPISYPSSGAPINEPVSPITTDTKTQPLPIGYNQFVPADEKGNWGTPSDKAVARNWPSDLGGGQYVVDPSQPGEMIKSERAIMDYKLNPGAKQKLLGNLSPALYQVDHIIPLWAGGADTLNNLQVVDNPTHEKKTAIQAVALTLLANKKIDLNEARNLAFTWKDKDPSGLPDASEIDKLGGYIPLTTAERMVQKWKDDISKPKTMKYFGESFKEKMNKFGEGWLPDIVREPIKGFVGGTLADIVPGTEASEDSSTAAKISNVIGNIAGTIFGLGKFAKGLSWTMKGIKSLTGTTKAINIANDAMKTAGLVTDIGNLSAKTINAKNRAEILKKMASSAGLLSLWGQVSLTGQDVTGKVDAEFKDHVNKFFSDIAFGSLLGSAGQNVKGYARVGLGTAALSLMEGEDIGPALQNAGLMTALHAMGYKRGMLDPKIQIGSEEAYKMSASTINKYLGDVVPTVKKGQNVPEILKLDIPKLDSMRVEYQQKYPNDQRFQNMGVITNETEAIDFIEKASRRQLGNLIAKSDGTISQEQIKQEMTRIITAKNQLYNQTLPPESRAKKEWEDLVSMGSKLKPGIKTEQIRMASNANENLNKIPKDIPDKKYDNPQGLKFPTGKGGVTGYGGNLDVEAKKNIDDFAKYPEKYDGKIYIPKTDAETAAIQRGVNYDYLANGKPAPTEVPEHTLRVFVKTKEGEFKPVGYMPQEGSFDAKKYDLNMTYREQINRFRHTIETAKNPDELISMFGKDKSVIVLDKKTADFIFEKKNTLSDEELYSLLKPKDIYFKLDSNLNNTNIFKKMDELGIDNLVIDPLKAWEVNGPRPRYNPENPYLNIDISEQDWLRSLAIKNGTTGKEVSPEIKKITKIIEKLVNKEETNKISKTIENVVSKTKPVIQPKLPIKDTPNIPLKSLTSSIETTKPIEPTSTLSTTKIEPKIDYLNKEIPISKRYAKNTNNELVDQFFGKMVHDIEYRKVKPSSPEELEKIYMNIVDSFRVKNPGLPEKEFKNILEDAKSRARFYVQELVDDTYKGTKYFGTEDVYNRERVEAPDIKKLSRDEALAKEFGLKLKEPNDAGIRYLELDKRGNPIFSEEYLKDHPKTKGNPLDVWGSFLGNELKANKAELSLQSKTWKNQIDQMKNSKNPYSKGVAESLDKALSEKYAIKDPKTGEIKHDWHESWKLNSGLKKIKSLFLTKNEEGQLITEPFRNIMAAGSKKGYKGIQKDVQKAYAKTRDITEKAQEARLNDMSSSKARDLPTGMRVKDPNQIVDVTEDLTPYDLLHSGLIRKEVRDNLIERYNNIISFGEIKPERRVETRIGSGGEKILGTVDEMNRLFTGIKKLSEYIPESKEWKPGKRIILKNKGEPTFEEGVNDGIKIAAQIYKLNSSPGFVNFEKIKEIALKNKPNKEGGYASIKAILGTLGVTGAAGLASINNTTTYKAKEDTGIKRISNSDLGNVIKQMESSGGIDKRNADKGEVKWKYGLTDIAIKELKRVGLIDKIDINNEEQVRDASIKYFKLMRERHPELSDAEIYTDYYWAGSKGDQREKTINKFNELTKL